MYSQPVAVAHPGFGLRSPAACAVRWPLSRRLTLEVLLTLTVAAIILLSMYFMNDRSYASESDSVISFGINAGSEPVQRNIPAFEETLTYNGVRAVIAGDAEYSISARVQSTKSYSDEMGDIVPYDFMLAWGEMAEDDVSSGLAWEQSDRRGQVSGTLGGSDGPDVSTGYVISHVSNNHMVPASDSIRAALATVQPGDLVRIDGVLVDVKAFSGNQSYTVTTSKTRSDQGDGACEVVFVEMLRINGNTYR